jgi:hypothetical protein
MRTDGELGVMRVFPPKVVVDPLWMRESEMREPWPLRTSTWGPFNWEEPFVPINPGDGSEDEPSGDPPAPSTVPHED